MCVCLCESLPGIYMCEIMSLDGPWRCGIVTMARKPPASSRRGTGRHQTNPRQRNPRPNAHNGRTSGPVDGQRAPGPDRAKATIECEVAHGTRTQWTRHPPRPPGEGPKFPRVSTSHTHPGYPHSQPEGQLSGRRKKGAHGAIGDKSSDPFNAL